MYSSSIFIFIAALAAIAYAHDTHFYRHNYHARRPTYSPGATQPAGSTTSNSNVSPYWLEDIKHQGVAAFNKQASNYTVFRNVKDFGAKGDGSTDDTAAINLAIKSGGRCAPGVCGSSTTTPATVYFPCGTYVVSASIVDYYYTNLIGNPNCSPDLPTIKATSNVTTFLLDGDQYQSGGALGFGSTNVFWRQVRNLKLDVTAVPASINVSAVHWPTGQATSLSNLVFQMSSVNGTQHQGVYIESGSGGFMNDLTFYGGRYGMVNGNQQFTMRNLTFYNAVTAIMQLWDWGWTYKNINIFNSTVGLNISSGGSVAQSVGSVTMLDSSISDTKIGILTAHSATSQPASGGSLILENIQLNNVGTAVQGANPATALAGSAGRSIITAWGEGHFYSSNGSTSTQGQISAVERSASLVSGSKYYERSKPQYEDLPLTSFISARDAGAKGDGVTDDTTSLQRAILDATAQGKVLFVDHGDYKVSRTIYIPHGSKIVGESYPVILSSGEFFSHIDAPQPVVRVGLPQEAGSIEWSDMIVSTQGSQAGAVLIEWNLAAQSGAPSGLWDVHTRIGGFAGSNLQLSQCPTTPTTPTSSANVSSSCIAAFMGMHVTKSASGLYMENVWLWTADHDVEDFNLTQITVYTGRGLLVESTAGGLWLYGTAVEHNVLYEYQFVNTKDVMMGQIQTETAYYQPNPDATIPFRPVASFSDPVFSSTGSSPSGSNSTTVNNANGWGLRVVDSQNINIYGAGLYSFFNNYSTNCSDQGNGEACQSRILSIEGQSSVNVYNLNTVGTTNLVTRDGKDVVPYAPNLNGFVDTIARYTT
ncbi:MAG: hypothetical protein M1820_001679 [Bogoriella megaspora]|nr:MAG: hypothetical protein M1820_001679 [Bogoriella megaspora]